MRRNLLLSDEPIPFSRRALLLGTGAFVLAGCWALGTTYYILFKDELAQRYLARQAELRFTFEDRVADLQQRLEREITQNLVERTTSRKEVDALASRQAEIELRQLRLQNLAGRLGVADKRPVSPAQEVSVFPAPTSPGPSRTAETAAVRKPTPLDDGLVLRRDRAAGTAEATGDEVGKDAAPAPPARTGDRLSAIGASLGRMAERNKALALEMRLAIDGKAGRLRAALLGTGLRLPSPPSAAGGPFVPVPDAQPDANLSAAELSVEEWERLRFAVRSLPLDGPLAGELEQTSPFGYRLDPFTRSPALHTGADFRAEAGTPVRATASGRVVVTEYTGGYGNMVEVDHGGGIATRYGHLSAYMVAPGTTVAAGQAIGRAGSTGRSTGTHVHYEVRINGEPVDPERFLRAGRIVADAMRL